MVIMKHHLLVHTLIKYKLEGAIVVQSIGRTMVQYLLDMK